jgi:hypothetical protein
MRLIKRIGFRKCRQKVHERWNITAKSIEQLAFAIITNSKTVNDIYLLFTD